MLPSHLLATATATPSPSGSGTASEVVTPPEATFAEGWLRDDLGLPEWLAQWTGRALQLVLIVVLAAIAARVVRRLVRRVGDRLTDGKGIDIGMTAGRDGRGPSPRQGQRVDAIVNVVSSLGTAVVWTVAVVVGLATFGVNVGPLVAGAGIAGIALGFGAQEVVGDFLNGFFMLVEDQYAVGDIIDAGEASGVVEYIGLRTTRVRDVGGTLWHIPNGEIRRVGNMSQEWARAMLDVGVGYDADLPTAIEVIRATAIGLWEDDDGDWSDMILDEPEVWGVEELGDSSIAVRLVVKTRPGDQWNVARELRLRLRAALRSAEIEIPFPQRTVWLRTDATGTGTPTIGTLPVEQGSQGELRAAAVADEEEDGPTGDTVAQQRAGDAAEAARDSSRRSTARRADEYHEQEVRRAADDEAAASDATLERERPGDDAPDDSPDAGDADR